MPKNISIHGETFEVSTPYAEGQTIGAAEAKSLNQTRAENIANNFRKSVKEAIDAGAGLDAVRAEFAKYDAEYTFSAGGGAGGRSSMDPVEREARAIAKRGIVAAIRQAGKDPKDAKYTKEWYEEAIEKNWQKDHIMKEARKAVKAKQATTEVELDL